MLSRASLNRTLLARQLLLDRADLTPEQAVERVGGLQTQYAHRPTSGRVRGAGWTVAETRAVLDRLSLRDVRDPDGAQLVDLPRAPVVDGDTPAPVRFLSTFDAVLLLGHATRARLIPDEHRAKIFSSKLPQSLPTFLVDGQVAGTWRYIGGRVEPRPFAPLPATVRDEVEAEAERLTTFHREG